MSQEEALFLLCGYPVLIGLVFTMVCGFWTALRQSARDGTDRFNPRPGTEPFRPESKIKPFRKHPDMLKIDDE